MAHSCKNVTGNGDVTSGDTLLIGITNGAAAGSVVLRDGGAAGVVKATFPVGIGQHIDLGSSPMRFPGGMHATLDTTTSISFWLS